MERKKANMEGSGKSTRALGGTHGPGGRSRSGHGHSPPVSHQLQSRDGHSRHLVRLLALNYMHLSVTTLNVAPFPTNRAGSYSCLSMAMGPVAVAPLSDLVGTHLSLFTKVIGMRLLSSSTSPGS